MVKYYGELIRLGTVDSTLLNWNPVSSGAKCFEFTVGFSTSSTSFDKVSSNLSSWSSIFLVSLKGTKDSKLSVIYVIFFSTKVFFNRHRRFAGL